MHLGEQHEAIVKARHAAKRLGDGGEWATTTAAATATPVAAEERTAAVATATPVAVEERTAANGEGSDDGREGGWAVVEAPDSPLSAPAEGRRRSLSWASSEHHRTPSGNPSAVTEVRVAGTVQDPVKRRGSFLGFF